MLATVALDDINSTMLKTYDTFLQKKKKWLIHDSPYCHIIINPDLEHMVPPEILQEIKTYKIPIPQFRKKHDHFAEFKNVFKTVESLKPVVLPEKQGKKPKMKSGCPIRNSSLRMGDVFCMHKTPCCFFCQEIQGPCKNFAAFG